MGNHCKTEKQHGGIRCPATPIRHFGPPQGKGTTTPPRLMSVSSGFLVQGDLRQPR
jgi:hypothetical protein